MNLLQNPSFLNALCAIGLMFFLMALFGSLLFIMGMWADRDLPGEKK